MCRRTALHYASERGNIKTVMALLKAGADVHRKANDGYGSWGCILVWLRCSLCGGGRSVHSSLELQEWLL